MKVRYQGPCEELCGQEIEVPEHDCLDHLEHREGEHVETHGLDCGPYERWHEEWAECTVCGEKYEQREVDRMFAESNNGEKQQ